MYIYRTVVKETRAEPSKSHALVAHPIFYLSIFQMLWTIDIFFPVSSPFVKPFPVFIIQKLEMRESHLFIQFILFIMQQKGPWNHSAPVSWMFWTTGIDQHFRYLINFLWIVQAQRRFTSWLYSFHCAIDLLQCYSTHFNSILDFNFILLQIALRWLLEFYWKSLIAP